MTDTESTPPASMELRFSYDADAGKRLDHFLAETRGDLSRSRWQDLIRSGHVQVNARIVKPNCVLRRGDAVSCQIPAPVAMDAQPEDIPLDVLYEDDDILVVNKPPGLVVHPAPGHDAGTLVNALLHHCRDLSGIGGTARPGIVHRLDRDTSGCLVVAKSDSASQSLTAQFKDRQVEKIYRALVWGTPRPSRGTIHTLIARHPMQRKKMTARPLVPARRVPPGVESDDDDAIETARGREAITHYQVESVLGPVSLLRVRIETGRTHQIRVHLAHRHHPVVGDTTYGRARAHVLPAPVPRQMLHAAELSLLHPRHGDRRSFAAPLPADFKALVDALASFPGSPEVREDLNRRGGV